MAVDEQKFCVSNIAAHIRTASSPNRPSGKATATDTTMTRGNSHRLLLARCDPLL
jgi:hypothetical protein